VGSVEEQLLADLPQDSLLAICLCCNLWNEVLSIQRKVDGTLFRGSDGEQKRKIIGSLDQAAGEAGYRANRVWGDVIEDREVR